MQQVSIPVSVLLGRIFSFASCFSSLPVSLHTSVSLLSLCVCLFTLLFLFSLCLFTSSRLKCAGWWFLSLPLKLSWGRFQQMTLQQKASAKTANNCHFQGLSGSFIKCLFCARLLAENHLPAFEINFQEATGHFTGTEGEPFLAASDHQNSPRTSPILAYDKKARSRQQKEWKIRSTRKQRKRQDPDSKRNERYDRLENNAKNTLAIDRWWYGDFSEASTDRKKNKPEGCEKKKNGLFQSKDEGVKKATNKTVASCERCS